MDFSWFSAFRGRRLFRGHRLFVVIGFSWSWTFYALLRCADISIWLKSLILLFFYSFMFFVLRLSFALWCHGPFVVISFLRSPTFQRSVALSPSMAFQRSWAFQWSVMLREWACFEMGEYIPYTARSRNARRRREREEWGGAGGR